MRTLAGFTVLVVEDETFIATYLEEIFSEAGCRDVHLAASNAAAKQILGRHKPHVAVLDVNLGAEKSFATAEVLTAAKVPFIFVTSAPAEVIPAQHRHRPIVGKPFVPDDVIQTVLQVVNQ
jgi:CheY-like chemotaxis protein